MLPIAHQLKSLLSQKTTSQNQNERSTQKRVGRVANNKLPALLHYYSDIIFVSLTDFLLLTWFIYITSFKRFITAWITRTISLQRHNIYVCSRLFLTYLTPILLKLSTQLQFAYQSFSKFRGWVILLLSRLLYNVY